MKRNWRKEGIFWGVFGALILSTIWTYLSLKPRKDIDLPQAISLSVIPDYQIISEKSLLTWPKGTVFEQGMASYFYAAEPRIDLSPKIEIAGMEQGLITGTIQLRITLQAVNDQSQIYWSYPMSKTKEQEFVLSHGMPGQDDHDFFITDSIPINVMSAYEQITNISNELMFQNGIFQMIISSEVSVLGTINGSKIEKHITLMLPLTLQQVYFTIPKTEDNISLNSLNITINNSSLEQSLRSLIHDNLMQIIINLALLFIFLILFIVKNRSKEKSAKEHKRFKEWITEGSVEVKDKLKINIFGLEGLVDIAIDLDKRVIYDSRVSKYYVLTEDIIYIYDYERTKEIMDNKQQLGRLLMEQGLLQPEQLEIGLYHQRKIGGRLGDSLMALGFIDDTTLYSTLAKQQMVDYYELDVRREELPNNWLETINLQTARAMMILPLGMRADKKLVIACSEVSREGMKETLEEMFGSDIILVSSKPSAIYEILERIETQLLNNSNSNAGLVANMCEPSRLLTEEEKVQFITFYYRGNLPYGLLIKALGYADSVVLSQVPEQENVLHWTVNKNIVSSEVANLIKGLGKVIETMEWKCRQDKKLPTLLELLMQSNYLMPKTVEWVEHEVILQQLPIDQLLYTNFLASETTIKNALFLLDTMRSLLIT